MNSLKNCFGAPGRSIKSGIALSIISGTFLITILFSCGSSYEEKQAIESYAKQKQTEEARAANLADSVSAAEALPVTDTINGIGYNFIKKANMRCKVDNVLNTSRKIEDIVAFYGGHITLNDYRVENNYTSEINFKKDSTAHLTYYTPTDNITAKIPTKMLDSVLRKVVDLAEFVDYKKSTANNIKLQLLANKFIVKRANSAITNTIKNANNKANKFKESEQANESVMVKQQLADETQIKNLELIDEVNYSEINLELYQGMATLVKIKPVAPGIKTYEPSYLIKLGDAVVNGLSILGQIILALVNCWGVFAILIGSVVIGRIIYKKWLKPALS